MIGRAVILAVAIGAAGLIGARAGAAEQAIAREPLSKLPRTLASWRAVAESPLDPAALQLLGVDDYINRRYAAPGGQIVGLYIGYYASQRQGDTIHSPQNCLPGAGWQPIESSTQTLSAGGRPVLVNRYVVQKGLDRQVVLYWYEGRGRIVANEYLNKFWLIADAARLHRTNGALVRIMAPVVEEQADASRAAVDFAQAILPALPGYLP
jgi:EpsI family protein